MLVPRSFKYSSSASPPEARSTKLNESKPKSKTLFSQPDWSSSLAFSPPRRSLSAIESSPITSPTPQTSTTTTMRQASNPVEIPSPRSPTEFRPALTTRPRRQNAPRKSQSHNDVPHSDSLHPAVAALLAVTAIPPQKTSKQRRKRTSHASRRISIDELVYEWRNDSSLRSSFGSSAPLDQLLESTEDLTDDHSSYSRSSSCDSIPSLEADDDTSVMSVGSPASPESVTSQRSASTTPRKEKTFLTPEAEDCGIDHPLVSDDFDMDDYSHLQLLPEPKPKSDRPRRTSIFKSNLTSSFNALKSRALSSISSLNQAMNQMDAAFSDETLWQHPQLFPRFSSEVRPILFTSTPTRFQRRYLNPTPKTFEEQQHHWSRALCTLDDEDHFHYPMIQMQTYRRCPPPRKARSNSGSPDQPSEAGRASPQLGRQREVRENSNFLRVIVLELNMRREGKLEPGTAGKAKIWLPPRKLPVPSELVDGPISRRVPKRWVSVSADY
ncbi:hypothetical protein BDV97DRAFT_302128 [Delphinella strobiligena]|nr:hypothetical protein BDV97DRAFT_302128 [Delphinella strobiligena]